MSESEKELKVRKMIQKNYSSFYDVVNTMSRDEMKKELAILANYKAETDFAADNDEELKRAKEYVKNLNAPYTETSKILSLKMAYLHLIIKEQGGMDGAGEEG